MKNLSRYLFLVALVALLPMRMWAIHAGDTVSIEASSRYLTANGNNAVGNRNVNNQANTACLWIVESNSTGVYTFRNLSNNRYLRISGGTLSIDTYANRTGFYPITTTNFREGSNANEATTKLKVGTANNSRGIRYNSGWTTSTDNNQVTTLTIHKWSPNNSVVLYGPTISQQTVTFTYNATASKSFNIQYSLTLNNYIADLTTSSTARTIDNGTETFSNLNQIASVYGISCNIVTPSDYPNESVADLNYVLTNPNTSTRTITITPSGQTTGMDLLTEYVHVQLVKSATSPVVTTAAQLEDKQVLVTRDARYVDNSVDEIRVEAVPSSYMFAYDGVGSTIAFTINVYHRTGSITYLNGSQESSDITETPVTGVDVAANGSVSLFGTDGMPVSWAEISSISGNQVIARCTEANGLNMRYATLGVSYRYTCPNSVNHTAATLVAISQGTQFTGASVVLQHQKGVTGSDFNALGEQQTHEVYKTMYYIPNTLGRLGDAGRDNYVWLKAKEFDFRGYQRWYDRDTQLDVSAVFSQTVQSHDTQWKQQPLKANNGDAFMVIGSGSTSQGRYQTGVRNEYRDLPTPSVYSYSDNQVHHIACDVSNYKDYELDGSDGTITEPTLSYREIFTLRPASEMAAKMEESRTNATYYVEEYTIIAPADKVIPLAPEFYYRNGDVSERCYIYGSAGNYRRVGGTGGETATWYKCTFKNNVLGTPVALSNDNIESSTDQYRVPAYTMSNTNPKTRDTVVYILKTTNYKLCRFNVIYQPLSVVGPVAETTNDGTWEGAIITKNYMYSHYNVIDSLTFNYNKPNTDVETCYYTNLPWGEQSSGFVFNMEDSKSARSTQGSMHNFPYWGEYLFMNRIDASKHATYWTATQQHGGARNGYMMYVDGTKEPGLVASLSVKGHLCSGQQMYCCAWVANVGSRRTDNKMWPKFRFDIEGKDDGDENWIPVASYCSGDLDGSNTANLGKWFQVNFGIDLEEDYDNYRISVYNFASTNDGNDFAIDDIYIYASRPPLVAYQATTNCKSTTEDIQVVLRLDYGGLAGEDWSGHNIYYDIYNESTNANVQLKPFSLGYPTQPDTLYGKIMVPAVDYNPETDNEHVLDVRSDYANDYSQFLFDYIQLYRKVPDAIIFNNIKELMDTHVNDSSYYYMNGSDTVFMNNYVMKGFVKETMGDEERYVIYIIHDASMQAEFNYSVRMSGDPAQFAEALCALKTAVPVSNKVVIELNGDVQVTTQPLNLCANDIYRVGMRVFDIEYDIHTGVSDTVTGHCYDDWLLAPIFTTECEGTAEEKKACEAVRLKTKGIDISDATCLEYYGYKYNDIITAIVYDMRRTDTQNKNLTAATLSDLDPKSFNDQSNYEMIVDLVNKGKLLLYETEKEILMPAGAPDVAYVVLPIMGTATQLSDPTKPLDLCTDPVFVHLKVGNPDEYEIGIGKVAPSELPEVLKTKAPVVRASQADARTALTFTLQLMANVVFGDTITMESSNDPDCPSNAWFAYTPAIRYNLGGDNHNYYNTTDNNSVTINAVSSSRCPADKSFYQPRQGFKYMFRIPLMSESGQQSLSDGCPVAAIFLELYVVPDYVAWSPGKTQDNNWNNDDNWDIVDADGNPLYVDGSGNPRHIGQGFVPMGHTNVIINSVDANEGDTTSYPMLVPYSELESDHELVTYDFNYEATHCKNILFRDHAMLLNQHLLRYEKAYVDMVLPGAYWSIVSSPIAGVISGDMFSVQPTGTPDGTWALTQYGGTGGHRSGSDPYCYWMSLYDETTHLYNIGEGDGTSGWKVSYTESGWSKLANDVTHPFGPADGVAVIGYGPEDEYGEACTVRLPKADTEYSYWRNDEDSIYGASVSCGRPANYNSGNLIFHDNEEETYTLTNETAGNWFVFGNPTMAYINMTEFFAENTNFSTTFRTLYQNGWAAVDCTNARTTGNGHGTYYLEPLRGVMLQYTGTPTTSVTVKVTADMLSLAGFDHKAAHSTESGGASLAPARRMEVTLASCLNIEAYTEDATSKLTIWEDPKGADAYVAGEDAEVMISGNSSYMSTPLAMYSIADDHMLSIDVRHKIVSIPLAFADLDEAGEVDLWFDGASTFGYTLYFVDALTEETWEIIDGTHLHLQMPQDGSVRYYIRAEEHEVEEQGGPATNTGEVRTSQDDENHVDFISNRPGQVTVLSESAISSIECFDLAGRLIRTIDGSTMSSHNLITISLPQGANLVRVNNAKGSVTGKLLIK